MEVDKEELRALVIDEVDEARDIYELAVQLARFMPIESFERLVEAAGDKPLRFRDAEFDVESLRGLIPEIAFPAKDARGLIVRLGQVVRAVPAALGVDLESESGARRISRANNALIPGTSNRANATAVSHTILTANLRAAADAAAEDK